MSCSYHVKRITLAAISFLLLASPAALARRGNDLAITDGAGEQVQIKHSLFGRNKTIVKDRLGDGFAQQNGFFGSKTSEVSLLGNRVLRKKGILGNSEIDGSTILGANFVSKKGIFGRRKTSIDLSGSNQLVQSFLGHSKPPQGMPMSQGKPMSQGMPMSQEMPMSRDIPMPQSMPMSMPAGQSAPMVIPSGSAPFDVNVNGEPVH